MGCSGLGSDPERIHLREPPAGGGGATGSAGVLNVTVDDQLLISESDV